jgi:8-oxo-dGTP pyrophosphatase MutT (NUDIX family)
MIRQNGLLLRERVACFVFNDKKEVLTAPNPYRDTYIFPGGGIEEGQSIIDAAKVECLEEVGIEIGSIEELPIPPRITLMSGETKKLVRGLKNRWHDGTIIYGVKALYVRDDNRLLGSVGDELKGKCWMDVRRVIEKLHAHSLTDDLFTDWCAYYAEALTLISSKEPSSL